MKSMILEKITSSRQTRDNHKKKKKKGKQQFKLHLSAKIMTMISTKKQRDSRDF